MATGLILPRFTELVTNTSSAVTLEDKINKETGGSEHLSKGRGN